MRRWQLTLGLGALALAGVALATGLRPNRDDDERIDAEIVPLDDVDSPVPEAGMEIPPAEVHQAPAPPPIPEIHEPPAPPRAPRPRVAPTHIPELDVRSDGLPADFELRGGCRLGAPR